MHTTTLFIVLSLLAGLDVHAQNTFPSSGNVGIGTTNPTEQLHVVGTVMAERTGATLDFPNIRLYNNTVSTGIPGEKRADIYLENASGQLVFRNVTGRGYRFVDASASVAWLNLVESGEAQFNAAGWLSRSNNGSPAVALKLGQNNANDAPVVSLATEDANGSNTVNWASSRYSHAVNFKRQSPTGARDILQLGGQEGGENFITILSTDGITPKIKLTGENPSYIIGSLGIGTNDPKGYKLAVAGNMIAEKVKVKLQTSWPDYVFDHSYKLPSLKEVEAFITKNKHLPEVPSAAIIEKEGIDLGNNQTILLKKIEELTLYLIEQNKRIEKLEADNKALHSENQTIKAKLVIE